MRKCTVALQLQPSLLEEVRGTAIAEGVSMNQLITGAVAEQLSDLRAAGCCRERTTRSRIPRAPEILSPAAVGNRRSRAASCRLRPDAWTQDLSLHAASAARTGSRRCPACRPAAPVDGAAGSRRRGSRRSIKSALMQVPFHGPLGRAGRCTSCLPPSNDGHVKKEESKPQNKCPGFFFRYSMKTYHLKVCFYLLNIR
jgi:hypothetical protein